MDNYDKSYLVAMPTRSNEIANKEYDYRDIAFLQCHSNFENVDNGFGRNVLYGETYTYHNKLDFEDFNLKDNSTFRKRITRMIKIEDSLLALEKVKGEVIYRIEYAKEGKYFVTVPYPILKTLVKEAKSNTIKVYCFLCYQLKDAPKQLSQEFIAKGVGLSRVATIREILEYLEKVGLITRELLPVNIDVEKGSNRRTICSTKEYKYGLVKLNNWKRFR